MHKEIFFIPNILEYIRLCLLGFFIYLTNPMLRFFFMVTSMGLDGLDGSIARRLNQRSALGAHLDLWIDLFERLILSLIVIASFTSFFIRCVFLFFTINDFLCHAAMNYYMHRKYKNVDSASQSTYLKQELQQTGYLTGLYYTQPYMLYSNILGSLFLLLCLYNPFVPMPIVALFLLGYLFRQICLVEKSFMLIKKFYYLQANSPSDRNC